MTEEIIRSMEIIDTGERKRMIVQLGDGLANVPFEQKWFKEFGYIFLGPEFEETHHIKIPKRHPNNHKKRDIVIHGFTDDPRIVEFYRENMWEEVE